MKTLLARVLHSIAAVWWGGAVMVAAARVGAAARQRARGAGRHAEAVVLGERDVAHHRLAQVRRHVHQLLRHAADVNARAAQARALDDGDLGAVRRSTAATPTTRSLKAYRGSRPASK